HSGHILMTGFTQSDTGIATPGTWKTYHDNTDFDSLNQPTFDAYLIMYDFTGKRLWGTYFGDSLTDDVRGIAVNSHNEIFIAGSTYSTKGIAYGDAYSDAYQEIL